MKKFLLIITLLSAFYTAYSQDINMQNGTFNQCSGVFYDSGGVAGNYADGESFVVTICPDGPDQFIQLDFTLFSTQLGSDVLTVYDGDDTTGAIIGTYSGGGAANNPGTVSASTTSPTGCITIEFVSDGTANTLGWAADISCLQSCQVITPSIDSTVPVANAGVIQIPLGGDVTFNGSATFEVDGTGAVYNWNFGDATTGAGQTVNHVFNNTGLFTVTLTVTDTNPTGCSETTTIQVEVLSPYIDVDQTTYTVPELVEDVLIDSPCAAVSNINWSTGTNFGQENGIGYFSAIPGAFPFESGIILVSGDANDAEGPETFSQNTGGWAGDVDLENAIPGLNNSNDATYIEFDFVPIASSISFDFLFASEEYGTFQCTYTDAFAFLLTDLTTGVTTNLAIVPGTTDVVSVLNVRDAAYNGGCPSVNAGFFDEYYGAGGLPAANSPTNFLGRTRSMTAFSNVIPNNNYRIKLVIADAIDSILNAGVFLGAGTFNLGGELGDDVTIAQGNAICSGGIIPLDTNLPTATHTWYIDGVVIPGETGSTLDADQNGTYSVDVVFSTTCQASDSVIIEFISSPTVENTIDVLTCFNPTGAEIFDLSVNDVEVIGTQNAADVNVSYHNRLVDAQTDINPILDPVNYIGSGTYPEVVYVRIEDAASQLCWDTSSFTIDVITSVINQAPNMEICDDLTNDGFELFDLESQTLAILGTQLPADYIVTYHNTFAEADTDSNALTSPYNGSNGEFIFVRIESTIDPSCYSASQLPHGGFTLIVNPNATATQPMDMVVCDDAANDGLEVFDLTSQEAVILGGQNPASYTVSFYENLADVAIDNNPILTSGAYQNTIAFQQTIYVRVNDNANPTCYGSTQFDLIINPLPTAVPPTALEVCDDGTPDGFTSIDLSIKNNEISGGNPAYAVTYYLTQAFADSATNPLSIPYTNVSNPQIIFVRVEDTNTSCYTTTTLQLDVQQAPVAFAPTPLEFCDPDSDGFGVFTLTDSEAEITGGAPGLTVTYHETSADADNNVNPLTSPYNNIVEDMQTIYVRVESATIATACATFVDLILQVNPTPQITDPSPLEFCDNDADGIAVFDLELNNAEILNQLDADATNDLAAADYTITFYTTAANAAVPQNAIATPNAYINTTPNMQTIWVRVDDNANGCSTITTMDLIVNPLPVLVQPTPLALCDYNNPGDEVEAFNLEDANAEILAGQTGITLTHYLTQLGADTADPADQISSPYTNVVNPQTVYIRAEDNVTGCVSTITLDLRVNPIPSPVVNPTPLVECDDDNDGFTTFDLDSQTATILNSEPDVSISYHETSADAANDLNPLVSPYTNIVAYNQMIYVRAENDLTGCITVVILPLEVQDSPVVPVVLDDYIVCDDNNDGFNQFDFDTVMTPQILGTQNPADFVLTYHTTLLNAENGTSPIVNTGNYTNATNPQTIYIRLEGIANGCVTTGEFIIRVEAPPVIVQPTPLAICDELDANYYENNDDMATFDLTVKNDEITAGNVSWIVTYYETQADADADANAIADPTMYTNMMVGTNPANPQTVYVRVTDADTGCFSFTTLTIRVLPNPTPTPTPDNLELCDDVNVVGPNDLIEIFDLTTNEVATINGETGVSASYYTDLDEALMGTNQIVDPTMHSNEDPANPGAAITPQTIYVRVTNGTDAMGTAGTGCYTIVSFDVIVNPLPVVSPIEDYIYCELFNDGQYGFDLDSKTDEILNGQDPTIFTVTYHETQGEADTSMNALSSPYTNTSNPQTIFVNITNTVTGCDTTTTFNIEVQEAAQANPDMAPIVYEICDDNMETDGDTTNDSAQFDLLTQNPDVLDGQDAANYIVSYYATQTDADAATNPLPFLYENTVNPQVIYVRVDNDIQSVGPISLDLVALGTTGLDVNGDGAIDTIDTDGDGVFDLLDVNNDMVSDGFDNEPDGIIDFIDLDGDGLGDLVDLDNDGVVDNGIDSSICYETAEVTLQVNPLPEFEIEDSYLLCINTNGTEVINTPVIDTGLNTTDYTFEWLLEGATLTGETGSSLTPTQGGNYTVIVTDVTTSGVTMCQNSATTLVEESEPPVIEYEVTTEAFADVHNIMVTATGNGISAYEFQLNDGVWEAGVLNTDGSYTYTFTDVAGGDHIVTARDINGCGESSLPVSVMDYPHFFTPNDDGFNDTWNIYGIQNQPDAKIYIFDRYGKLLKQLSPTGLGWDGTFNGNPMPTSDYWFTVDYKEPNDLTQQKQFKAHFTLKR
ncbi:choice-of-anchor L domain-containing protein [Olleya sp. R77988]|uniref:choice-of-anchor L domain-containing protein n=1 Tax=Olleya sp. R77988 TaxID=3093875 RepID=UPI0037CC036D